MAGTMRGTVHVRALSPIIHFLHEPISITLFDIKMLMRAVRTEMSRREALWDNQDGTKFGDGAVWNI
jgi:hypothetical protein